MGSNSRDEKAIRTLLNRWHRAMGAGDLAALLSMISEDAVFLAAERTPLRGRAAFAQELAALTESCTIQSSAEIEEVLVSGDLACCWATQTVTTSPLQGSRTDRAARAGALDLPQGVRRTLGARARRQHARVRRRRAGAQGRQPRARADGRRPRRLSAGRGFAARSCVSPRRGNFRPPGCPRRARPYLTSPRPRCSRCWRWSRSRRTRSSRAWRWAAGSWTPPPSPRRGWRQVRWCCRCWCGCAGNRSAGRRRAGARWSARWRWRSTRRRSRSPTCASARRRARCCCSARFRSR